MLYILTGLGAFAISFLLEGHVFVNITDRPLFSYAVTAVFESAKVMTIMMHRFLISRKGEAIPGIVQSLTLVFKASLLFLSLLCSVGMLAGYLDGPNRESVRTKDQALITQLYERNRRELQSEYKQRLQMALDHIERQYQGRHDQLNAFYQPRIAKEEKLRDSEFNNVVGGVRKGPRWREHDRKVQSLRQAFVEAQRKLYQAESDETRETKNSLASDLKTDLKKLKNQMQTRLTAVSQSAYADDERVLNKMVAALLKTIKNGAGIEIAYLKFVIFFSLLVSFLLESTIYIVFNYLIVSHQSIFTLQHDLHIGKQAIKATTKDELFRDQVHHNTLKSKVKNRVRHTREQAANFAASALNF